VWAYRRRWLPAVLDAVREHGTAAELHLLRNDGEAERLLERLSVSG
jgi:hypothetical protein